MLSISKENWESRKEMFTFMDINRRRQVNMDSWWQVVTVSREKKPKLRAINKVPTTNHVFCTTEPQKVLATGSNRCLQKYLELKLRYSWAPRPPPPACEPGIPPLPWPPSRSERMNHRSCKETYCAGPMCPSDHSSSLMTSWQERLGDSSLGKLISKGRGGIWLICEICHNNFLSPLDWHKLHISWKISQRGCDQNCIISLLDMNEPTRIMGLRNPQNMKDKMPKTD